MNAVTNNRNRSSELLHRWAQALFILILLVPAMGCGDRNTEPELVPDRTACSNCKMLISETVYAAAFRTSEGDDRMFDDIGCMLENIASNPDIKPKQIWARDMKTDKWINAADGYYAYSKALRTPMGFGYVAFADQQQAASQAGADGVVLHGFGALQDHRHSNSQ